MIAKQSYKNCGLRKMIETGLKTKIISGASPRADTCSAICRGCLKIINRYDIPSSAGWRIWNRRNSFKNNDSISLGS